ncbi:MAG TPA: serine hydrolase domain-containing protein [Vicinamibacterales bacterium]|nr:serine hydrolase domain-containing protein [Vicinamibacterales bacterium]
MAAKKSWTKTLLLMFGVGLAMLPVAIMGLYVYASATAEVVHPNPQDVQSKTDTKLVGKWQGAVGQAQQIVRSSLSEQNLPGLSVAVAAGGELVWAEGFGWADIEKRVAVGPETRFRMGTASKVLTSAAVGLLLEKERLKLEDEIQTYVPEFPKKQWSVTLRQLMGHLAGVGNDGGDEGPLYSVACDSPVEGVKQFAENSLVFEAGTLSFEPGSEYRYSTYGWILVSAAVEAAAEEPFMTFMQTRVFDPLGMKDTRADSVTKEIPDRAAPYFPRFSADPRYGLDLMRPIDYSCYSGASAFLSTPSDLVRYAQAFHSGKLLKPATVELLQTSQRLTSGPETGYGLGWDLETVKLSGQQTRVIGHDGESLGGTVMSLMTFPEHDISVAVMSNSAYADTPGVGLKIAQVFAEQGSTPARK